MKSMIEFGGGEAANEPVATRSGVGWELVSAWNGRVHVRMYGELDERAGVHAADAVVAGLETGAATLLLDVRELEEFTQSARAAWVEILSPHAERIERIVMVGGNALTRMAVAVLAMKLGVMMEKHSEFPDATELDAQLEPRPDSAMPTNAHGDLDAPSRRERVRWTELP